jgi:hypothetical protein
MKGMNQDNPDKHQTGLTGLPKFNGTDVFQPPTMPQPPVMQKVQQKPDPWWTNENIIIRLWGSFGAIITFIGVAFLVAWGIKNGWLTPTVRVVLATLLGIALLATTPVLQRRQLHSAAVGSVYVTSLLTLGATTISVGYIFDMCPPIVASVVLGILVAAYGLGNRWLAHEGVAIAVAIASFILLGWHISRGGTTPHVFPYSLPGLLLLLTAYRRPTWSAAQLAAGVLIFAGAAIGDTGDSCFFLLGAMLITIVLRGHWLINVGLYTVMFFSDAHQIYFLLAFGIFVLWIYLERTNPVPWGLIAVNFLSFHSNLSLVQAGYFVAFAIIIWFLRWIDYREILWGLWALIGLYLVRGLLVAAIFNRPIVLARTHPMVCWAIVIILGVAVYHYKQILQLPKPMLTVLAVIGLVFSMITVLLITSTVISSDVGFYAGHAIVSVAWLLLAAWLAIWRHASLSVSMFLSIGAISKLIFFDMQAIQGVPRIAAFIFSGIILIGIAIGYASKGAKKEPVYEPAT